MFEKYTTIGNLIQCGLFTEEELIKAYVQTGKELPEPKDTNVYGDMKYTSRNINSKDYIFYKAIKLANGKQMVNKF